MSEKKNMTKAAGVVASATFISRILGYIRDFVFAWFFGAGLFSDAFIAAFRIPNLLRRLFGEGSLSIAFIPVFTKYLSDQGRDEAFMLARSALRFLSVILVVVVIAGIFLAPFIVKAIAYGFTDSPDKFSLTVTLTRIMFPYIFFIGLVALCMGILNALGHFAAPALAPVLLNLAMIGSILIASYLSEDMTFRVYGLATGVLIGGILQLALQAPFLIKKGFYFWEKTKIYHEGFRRIGILMIPATFGAAVYQINTLVITLLASLLPGGSITYLYFADRLVQFPLGVFGLAVATAVLPSLSRQAAKKDYHAVKQTFAHAMRLVLFITIPAMAGLIVLREPIIALLFKRGAFDARAVQLTAYALLYYSFGLWAFSAVRIVVNTFYALQDTLTPVLTAAASIAVNIVLGIILMKWLGHGGLALALSISSIFNLVLLTRSLRIKLGKLGFKEIVRSASKTLICAVLMGIIVKGVSVYIIPVESGTFTGLLSGLAVSILAGLGTYGLLAFVFRSPELYDVMAVIFRGRKKT